MFKMQKKNEERIRRHKRVRRIVNGTPECPRLNVFRSNTNIYAQVIDDTTGKTLLSCSSLELKLENGGNIEAAKKVGEAIAKKCLETNHAFSIESDSGVELFVHFGIDTVELKGEGFKRIAEEGQRVKVGDTVIEFDLPLLEEKAKSTLTPVVISNMDEIKELIKLSGSVTVGETPVIRIKK